MDKIIINDLQLHCLIGVHPHERSEKQLLLLDIELAVDTRPAASSDALADAVDYDAVVNCLRQWAAPSSFTLLEALADYLARQLLQHFAVSAVRLRISKPNILAEVGYVGVEIVRGSVVE